MEKFILKYLTWGSDTETIIAEDIEQASEIVKKRGLNIGYSLKPFDVWEEEHNPPKMYKVEIKKKTGDNLEDFLSWAAEYKESPAEVENTAETIGRFCLEYMGRECDKIPALFVEDHNGNIIEYYVFLDSETLRHETVTL